MQALIRSEFADHTVICVEHQLENILDYDKIAVFDNGMLVEFDSPEALMQTNSLSKQMIEPRLPLRVGLQ
jgi:ATP-binding cassette subfamily C (CFTR/MRP) protein 1